jgi:hypothetical protein
LIAVAAPIGAWKWCMEAGGFDVVWEICAAQSNLARANIS